MYITKNYSNKVRFQILTAMSMKIDVFSDVAPYNATDVYRRFRGACSLNNRSCKSLIAANTSETTVTFYQTARGATIQKTIAFILMKIRKVTRRTGKHNVRITA
jgi:hypothetical protein